MSSAELKKLDEKLDKVINITIEYRVEQAVIKIQVKIMWGIFALIGTSLLLFTLSKLWNHVF